jgi:hypothetical protein
MGFHLALLRAFLICFAFSGCIARELSVEANNLGLDSALHASRTKVQSITPWALKP